MILFGVMIANSPVLKLFSVFTVEQPYGFGGFSCSSYISLIYYIYIAKILTVSYMLVRHEQGITVTKLFLKLKYIFMCLWLFIAESTFYR